MTKITVMLVDDHELICNGISSLLHGAPGIEVVAVVRDGRAAVTEAVRLRPEVVLMDIAMPGMSGIEATWRIADVAPESKVVALSQHADPSYVDSMLDAGATGYLLKNCGYTELLHGIRRAAAGEQVISEKLTELWSLALRKHGAGGCRTGASRAWSATESVRPDCGSGGKNCGRRPVSMAFNGSDGCRDRGCPPG